MDPQVSETARRSPNFGYLATHDEQLSLLGAYAEAYVYTDPNGSIGKSRQFGERLGKLLWAVFQPPGNPGTQDQRIRTLHERGVITDLVRGLFTDIRRIGNSGLHDHLDDKAHALRLVRACYDLGAWFHRTATDASEPPAFVPPALPEERSSTDTEYTALRAQINEYREELIAIRFTLSDQSTRLDEQSAQAAAESEARAAAEREILATVKDHAKLRELVRELSDQLTQLQAGLPAVAPRPVITPARRDALVLRARRSSDRILVDKLLSLAAQLRHEGVSMGDYIDQFATLLFLKLAHERAMAGDSSQALVPLHLGWQSLRTCEDDQLIRSFDELARELSDQNGMFRHAAVHQIRTPKTLRAIIEQIDQEHWSTTEEGWPGKDFDELLTRFAADHRSGGGQYFTPRALVHAMVECVRPTARDTIVDPACGTGGFLIGAYEHIMRNHELTPDDIEHVADGGISGTELVTQTARLAQLNLLLHGLGRTDGSELVEVRDALATRPHRRASLVLSNPPLGSRSETVWVDQDGHVHRADTPPRSDFWTATKDMGLNFIQHVHTLLRIGGRAAVVVPDGALFRGGAGETVRRNLLQECDLHTILRLPIGVFYAAGIRANVLFFEKKGPQSPRPGTGHLWVYDFRTDRPFTKTHQLRRRDLDDFVASYRPGEPRESRTESDRFRVFSHQELIERSNVNLDVTWLETEGAS